MSWTALLMLRWYDELEKMPVFWLMQKIMRWLYLEYSMKWFFPGWLDLKTMQPMNHLNASPETSLSVTFYLNCMSLHIRKSINGQHLKP